MADSKKRHDEKSVTQLERGADGAHAVDINRNLEAKIKNPLDGVPRDQLMRDVEFFAKEKGLEDQLPILRKGALLAQDPDNYENIGGDEELTAEEKAVLVQEKEHKWRLPFKLYLTIVTCAIGAAVQGWDQTGSNGANLFFPAVYGIGGKSAHDQLIVGLVNAGPYIGSAVIGCWLSDP